MFSYDLAVNEVNFETEDPSPRAQETKYLLNNVINIDVINVAQECLDQFNLMRNCNLTLMQLALLTRLYHQFAPEDGDGIDGGDSQIFNGCWYKWPIHWDYTENQICILKHLKMRKLTICVVRFGIWLLFKISMVL